MSGLGCRFSLLLGGPDEQAQRQEFHVLQVDTQAHKPSSGGSFAESLLRQALSQPWPIFLAQGACVLLRHMVRIRPSVPGLCSVQKPISVA